MAETGNIKKFPDPDRVKDEASAWITLTDRRDLTAAERAEFRKWLERSKQHKEQYEHLLQLWGDFDRLAELPDHNMQKVFGGNAATSLRFHFGRRAALSAIAASLAVVVGSVHVFQPFRASPITQQKLLRTAFGEHKSFTLVDSSSITLNTDSIVDISYSRSVRDIRLVQGEAHFDVACDLDRPFVVYAGDNIVRAIGTAFVVRLDEGDVEITVAEGRVELLTQARPQLMPNDEPLISAKAKLITEIVAGDNARLKRDEVERIVPLSDAALSRKLSWRRGLLSFTGEPLSEVISEVNRYTHYEIEIEDPAIENLPIGGYFKVGEVGELLLALENTFDLEIERVSASHVRLKQAS